MKINKNLIALGVLLLSLIVIWFIGEEADKTYNFNIKTFTDDKIMVVLQNCSNILAEEGKTYANQYNCEKISIHSDKIDFKKIPDFGSCSGVVYYTGEGWLFIEEGD